MQATLTRGISLAVAGLVAVHAEVAVGSFTKAIAPVQLTLKDIGVRTRGSTKAAGVFEGVYVAGNQYERFVRGLPLFDASAIGAGPFTSASLELGFFRNLISLDGSFDMELRMFGIGELALTAGNQQAFGQMTGDAGGPFTSLGSIPIDRTTSTTQVLEFDAADLVALNALAVSGQPRIGFALMEFGNNLTPLNEIAFHPKSTRLVLTEVPEPSLIATALPGIAVALTCTRRRRR